MKYLIKILNQNLDKIVCDFNKSLLKHSSEFNGSICHYDLFCYIDNMGYREKFYEEIELENITILYKYEYTSDSNKIITELSIYNNPANGNTIRYKGDGYYKEYIPKSIKWKNFIEPLNEKILVKVDPMEFIEEFVMEYGSVALKRNLNLSKILR